MLETDRNDLQTAQDAMQKELFAWMFFFGGFGAEIIIDYGLRHIDGNMQTGGLPSLLWYGIQFILGWLAVTWLFQATLNVESFWKRIAIVFMQFVIGFALYITIGVSYMANSGVNDF